MEFPHLFKSALIGNLRIRNRIVMAPLCTSLSFGDGLVSERMIDYYGARARGGVGMIITEYICIDSKLGRAKASQLILDTDEAIGSHNLLTERVHRFNGCKIIAQLHHAGRQTNKRLTRGLKAVAPSNVPTEKYPETVHELTIPEIASLVVNFGDAAYRAKIAGYDGVEIHAAHGYLINQFLSPFFNKRQDVYGCDRQGRMRFFREIMNAVRERVGPDYPILVRLSVDEYLPGGLDLEESCALVQEMENLGVSAIDVTRGTFEAPEKTCEGMDQPQGCRVALADKIKKCVCIPVIIVGNIKHPIMANEIIEEGRADFVALGRALLADPWWAMKAKNGRSSEIRRCLSCNFCVSQRSANALSIQCAINPVTGNEREFNSFQQLPQGSKAMVIGGGPSGMEAAKVLALRGAHVQIWEKEERIGGQINIAVGANNKEWLHWIIEDQVKELRKLGVEISLNREATAENILNEDPNILIIATGAKPKMEETSELEGNGIAVISAWEVLGGQWKPEPKTFPTVAVWGGGRTGCEVAEVLAELCQEVILISNRTQDQIAGDYGRYIRPKTLECIFSHSRITLLKEHTVDDVKDGKLIVTSNTSPKTEINFKASALVVARGVKAVNDFADYPGKGIVAVIGDARKPRDLKSAVHDGFVSAFYLNSDKSR